MLFEAWQRINEPVEIATGAMAAFALVGFVGNGVSLLLLRHPQAESLNMRGAYLEVLGDLLGSAAVIVAAGVIALTGWTGADLVASVAIGLMILPRTLRLLKDATDVLLEATPKGVDMDHVRRHILEAPGVVDCHDLHAWTITSGMNVVSAHVVLAQGADPGTALSALSTLPRRRLRHRPQHVPARDGGPPPARGAEPRMTPAAGQRGRIGCRVSR